MSSEINDPTYLHFVRQIVAQGHLYSLLDEDDFYAECPSEIYEGHLGEEVLLSCFWENEEKAIECLTNEWHHYALEKIDLNDFLNDILPDCYEEQKLLGISFDAELYGLEVETLDLFGDILEQIQLQKRTEHYPRFHLWQTQWKNWLAEENKQRIMH